MKVGVTGHRPDKLWGYNIYVKPYLVLRSRFRQLLMDLNCEEGFSGMALGTDMVFALAILDLKKQGVDIKLHCAIPCKNHSSKWINPMDIALYNKILELADTVKIVSNVEYSPWTMQVRNKYIVNHVDKMVSLYNGDPTGGTANCVNYAKEVGKEIIIITPKEIEVAVNG